MRSLAEFVWSWRVLMAGSIAALTMVGVLIITLGLFLFVRPWSRSLYRRLVCKWCFSAWIEAMSLVLPRLGMTITADSDMLDGIGSGIIITNHQSELDWWAILMMARFVGLHGNIKVIVRESIKRVPLLGWFLQLAEFPFLGRSWVDYRSSLIAQFRSFAQEDFPTLFLIFPEGVQKDQRALQKSQEFAVREGRPQLNHLLLPHTTGFNACLEALRESFPVVYDVTLAYEYERENGTPPGPRAMLSGLSHFVNEDIPYRVHVHIKRFSMEEVVRDAHWLDARWDAKEQLLRHFHRTGNLTPNTGANGNVHGNGNHFMGRVNNGSTAMSPCSVRGNGEDASLHAVGVRRCDSRAVNKEAAVLSLARLSLLPLVLPLVLLFSLPLAMTAATGIVLHRIFSALNKLFRGQPLAVFDGGLTSPNLGGRRSARSPWVPRTPFTSPLAKVFDRQRQRSDGAANGKQQGLSKTNGSSNANGRDKVRWDMATR